MRTADVPQSHRNVLRGFWNTVCPVCGAPKSSFDSSGERIKGYV
ncbi:hypothetical protein CLOSTHATH_04543 [Hungatella hathewayi DSM 13479]|uniref:Uncharacterized protein n=1 Tax=Hungatella hathewayi DSM 13479 TaxID=566550 RepID=D3ALP7_9FIRM|nr:hypothetical protein CLOSTHATH_04543 [Hungatella hathewayi DSM 13479]